MMKKKIGRPRIPDSEKKIVFGFSISPYLARQIKDLSEDRKLSEVVEQALEDSLKRGYLSRLMRARS